MKVRPSPFYLKTFFIHKLIILFMMVSYSSAQDHYQDSEKQPTFEGFLKKHQEKYQNGEVHLQKESISTLNNQQLRSKQNSKTQTHYVSDLTQKESKFFHQEQIINKKTLQFQNNQPELSNKNNLNQRILNADIPPSFDWRNFTNVTQVKNSGSCGASHAFVTADFFEQEIISAQTHDSSINLSEMYLMSCHAENARCKNGPVESLIDQVLYKTGIPLETQHPYNPRKTPENICWQKNLFTVPNVSRMSYYNIQDAQKIKEIIYKKPAIAAVCASEFTLYSPDPENPQSRTLRCSPLDRKKNHHVLLVGYTQTEWIVKNSWGTNWGINGYAYISKDLFQDCCIGDEIHTTGVKTQTCSVQYCQTCVEENTCSVCEAGRYVYNNSTTGVQTCEECLQFDCDECYNYLGTCKLCSEGFTYDITMNQCVIQSVVNCNRMEENKCLECKPGYKLISQQNRCELNCENSNCQKCPKGPCIACKPGFSLSTLIMNEIEIKFCTTNFCLVQNCSLCNAAGQCVKCKPGYQFNLTSGQCYSDCQIPNCVSCSIDSSICTICADGLSWNAADNLCEVFNGTKNCLQFYAECQRCREGYALEFQTYQCLGFCPQQGCLDCHPYDNTICIECKPGYSADTSNGLMKCVKNPCNITDCQLCDSDGSKCLKCLGFTMYYNQTSNKCETQCSAIIGCRDCILQLNWCLYCATGYVMNADDYTCVPNPIENCYLISLFDPMIPVCWQCAPDYYPSMDTQLFGQQCVIGCDDYNCKVCDTEATYVCTKCLEQFYYLNLVDGSLQCSQAPNKIQNCILSSRNQSYCYGCRDYYYTNPQTGLCQIHTDCPQMCESCTYPDSNSGFYCKCKNGLVYQSVSKTCIQNPLNDTNCIRVSITNYDGIAIYCGQCKEGWTVDITTWKTCIPRCRDPNCKLCNDKTYLTCLECNPGYYFASIGRACLPCQIDVNNCQVCQQSKCVQCKFGYQLSPSGLQCKPISCNEKLVYDGFKCICPPGTYSYNLTCNPCSQLNCKQCNSLSCFSCNQGFFLFSNECKKCQPNCKICQPQTDKCLQCKNGYLYDENLRYCISVSALPRSYFISENIVVACPSDCLECTQQQKCKKCLPRYHEIGGRCFGCLNDCRTCYRGNLSICLSCYQGYHLSNIKTCIKCDDTNCKDCPISSQACVLCREGFYLDKGQCKFCKINDCLQCNYFGQCTKCLVGYTLMEDLTCQQCGGNCKSCNASDISQCFLSCNSTSYLQNNTCVSCPAQCEPCISNQICLSCTNGYVLRNGKCLKSCQKGCYECNQSDTSICLKCLGQYILQTDGKCSQNLGCSDDQSCSLCPLNFALINGDCVLCELGSQTCIQCSNKNISQCVQCLPGYYVSKGACLSCNENCLLCNNQGECNSCKDGYFLRLNTAVGNCLACDKMCKTCSGLADSCTSCHQGYELVVTQKCLRKEKIQGKMELDVPLSTFPSVSKSVRQRIIGCLGSDYENETKYYLITKLEQGSTILSFTVFLPDGLNEATTFTSFKNNISSISQIEGIAVISISQIILNSSKPQDNTKNQNGGNNQILNYYDSPVEDIDSSKKLAIILGIVIPGGVIILAIAAWVLRKKFFSKKVQNQSQLAAKQLPDQSMVQTNFKLNETVQLTLGSTPMKKDLISKVVINHKVSDFIYPQESHEKFQHIDRSQQKVEIQHEFALHSAKPEVQANLQNDNVEQFVEQITEKNQKLDPLRSNQQDNAIDEKKNKQSSNIEQNIEEKNNENIIQHQIQVIDEI